MDRRGAPRVFSQSVLSAAVECILACQIVVNGKRTVWCAQHDEVSLEPRPARAYEFGFAERFGKRWDHQILDDTAQAFG